MEGLPRIRLEPIRSTAWISREKEFFVAEQWPSGACYREVGLTLRPYVSSQALVAAEAVGELGYTMIDTPILDIFGLTDAYIARQGVIPIETYTMGKHHYAYIMQEKPDVFVFHSNIINHIPLLNQWGYSDLYQTFQVTDTQMQCNLLVGIAQASVPQLLPILAQNFVIEQVNTQSLPENTAATWPEGKR